MKHIPFIVAATLLVGATSCNKEVNPIVDNDQPVSTVKTRTFTAYADNGEATRTILNGNNITWAAGEAIYVFDGQAPRRFVSTNTEPASVVTFEGEAADATTYYAVSPAAMMSGSTITATIPVYQTATPNSFDPKAAISVAVSGDDPTVFQFKNAAAAVKFKISNEGVTKIRLDAIGGEPLAGKATITLGNDNTPSLSMVAAEAESCVILTPASGSFATGTDYVIAIAPGTYAGGFRLTLVKADGEYASFSNKTSQTLSRSDLMDFDTMPEVTNWKETEVKLFNESFSEFNVQGGNDGNYSGGNGTFNADDCDETGWTFDGNVYAASNCVRVGKNAGTTFTTRALDLSSGTVTLTFRAALFGSDGTRLSLSVDHGTVSKSFVTLVSGQWKEYSVTITGGTSETKITFSPAKRCYLDDIVISTPALEADPEVAEPIFEITDINPEGGFLPAAGGPASFKIHSTIPWTITSNSADGVSYSTVVNGDITTVNVVFGSIESGSRTIDYVITPSEGDPKTISFTQEYSSGTVVFIPGTDVGDGSVTKNGVTISMSSMYEDVYKTYKSSSMSVTATGGKRIQTIILTSTNEGQEKYGPGCFSLTNEQPGSYDYDGNIGTWSGSASSVSLYASLNQVRMTRIEVHLE